MPGKHRNELPPKSELELLFDYRPETGELIWKPRTPDMFQQTEGRTKDHACSQWNARWAGKPALDKVWKGYKIGRLNYQYVASHRIIWKLMTDETPDLIDHINGVRDDNRFENLRNVDEGGNKRNLRRRKERSGSSQFGVRFNKKNGKWVAQIQIGTFETEEEANAARKNAEALLGYDPNHGSFAALE